MAKTLVNDYPDVVDAVRFRDKGSYIIRHGDNSFKEKRVIFQRSHTFLIFSPLPCWKGTPKPL